MDEVSIADQFGQRVNERLVIRRCRFDAAIVYFREAAVEYGELGLGAANVNSVVHVRQQPGTALLERMNCNALNNTIDLS